MYMVQVNSSFIRMHVVVYCFLIKSIKLPRVVVVVLVLRLLQLPTPRYRIWFVVYSMLCLIIKWICKTQQNCISQIFQHLALNSMGKQLYKL